MKKLLIILAVLLLSTPAHAGLKAVAVGTSSGGGGGGSGTVTSVSVTTANGVSGSVATATTTPAISLTLGAITPTSINASGTITGALFSGSGASLTGIGTASLGGFTGSPSSTTYARGDGTWATVSSGSGSVSLGTAGYLAQYAVTGTTVSPIGTASISGDISCTSAGVCTNVGFQGLAIGTTTGTNSLVLNNAPNFTGNVGIGTATAANALDINGAASIGYNVAAPSNGLIVSGNVYIGTSSATSAPLVVTNNNFAMPTSYLGTAAAVLVNNTTAGLEIDAAGSQTEIWTARYDGTFASPTALQNAENIFVFGVGGYNGTALSGVTGGIHILTEGIWTNASEPTAVAFWTTPTSSTSQSERMRVTNGGSLVIGTTTPRNSATLDVNGGLNISSATMINSSTAFTNGAGASAGTLTNAPSVGNPTKWIPINDNGTTRYIPAW